MSATSEAVMDLKTAQVLGLSIPQPLSVWHR